MCVIFISIVLRPLVFVSLYRGSSTHTTSVTNVGCWTAKGERGIIGIKLSVSRTITIYVTKAKALQLVPICQCLVFTKAY